MTKRDRNARELAEILIRELGFEHLEPYQGAKHRWRVCCLGCNQETTITYSNAKKRKNKFCNTCSGSRQSVEAAADLMRDRGLEPLEPYRSAHYPWRCRCLKCGNEVTPTYTNVRTGRSQCAWCSRKRVEPSAIENRLKALGLQPLEPYPGADTPWPCRCMQCGRNVTPRWSNIKFGFAGCKFCSRGSLTETENTAEFRHFGFEPLEEFPGTNKPWKSLCLQCQTLCTPRLSNLRRGQGGCSVCADWGFDRSAKSIIYLLYSEEFLSIKIGVTQISNRDRRIQQHKSLGWEILSELEVQTGWKAEKIERATIKRWRASGAPPSVTPDDMPQSGHTETASVIHLDMDREVRQLIEAVEEENRLY